MEELTKSELIVLKCLVSCKIEKTKESIQQFEKDNNIKALFLDDLEKLKQINEKLIKILDKGGIYKCYLVD